MFGVVVKEVKDGVVVIFDCDGLNVCEVLFGFVVWCMGIKFNLFCEKLIEFLF